MLYDRGISSESRVNILHNVIMFLIRCLVVLVASIILTKYIGLIAVTILIVASIIIKVVLRIINKKKCVKKLDIDFDSMFDDEQKVRKYEEEIEEVKAVNGIIDGLENNKMSLRTGLDTDDGLEKIRDICKIYNKTGIIMRQESWMDMIYYKNYLKNKGEDIDISKVMVDCAKEYIRTRINNLHYVEIKLNDAVLSKMYKNYSLDIALANNNNTLTEIMIEQILVDKLTLMDVAYSMMYGKKKLNEGTWGGRE